MLLVHGLLHLFGYTHYDVKNRKSMRLLENMMYELKIDVFSNNTSINQTKLQELEDYNKNEKALEHFKPYMLYYRFLLE